MKKRTSILYWGGIVILSTILIAGLGLTAMNVTASVLGGSEYGPSPLKANEQVCENGLLFVDGQPVIEMGYAVRCFTPY